MINPFELMKNFENIKEKGEELKKILPTLKETGSAMGGEVVAVVNGEMRVESLKINPDLVKEGGAETLAVLITSAINNALSNMKARVANETNSLASSFGVNF